ncbi:unnamed protein product, partial [Owenia fusiformis]
MNVETLCYHFKASEYSPRSTIVESAPLLNSSQEQADKCMQLHAAHASKDGHSSIILLSNDTDVEVLCLYHQDSISAKLDVSTLASQLGHPLCKSLLGLHALSCCDSTSAFSMKGKQSIFQLAKVDNAMQ